MSPAEVWKKLGEPYSDREGNELGEYRIALFKGEGAIGMVTFIDHAVIETEWLPNQGPPRWEAEGIWLSLWGLD